MGITTVDWLQGIAAALYILFVLGQIAKWVARKRPRVPEGVGRLLLGIALLVVGAALGVLSVQDLSHGAKLGVEIGFCAVAGVGVMTLVLDWRAGRQSVKPIPQAAASLAVEAPTKAPTASSAPAGPSAASPPERLIADVTPKYLTDFYVDRMDFEGYASVERYIGTWMPVSGQVRNVSDHREVPGHRWLGVYMEWPLGHPHVSMFFNDPRWFDRLLLLKRGDSLSVLGRIHKVDRTTVVLEDCELVEEQESQATTSTDPAPPPPPPVPDSSPLSPNWKTRRRPLSQLTNDELYNVTLEVSKALWGLVSENQAGFGPGQTKKLENAAVARYQALASVNIEALADELDRRGFGRTGLSQLAKNAKSLAEIGAIAQHLAIASNQIPTENGKS